MCKACEQLEVLNKRLIEEMQKELSKSPSVEQMLSMLTDADILLGLGSKLIFTFLLFSRDMSEAKKELNKLFDVYLKRREEAWSEVLDDDENSKLGDLKAALEHIYGQSSSLFNEDNED